MTIETVGELLAALEEFDEDTPVRVAQQPSYPLAAVVNCVTELGPDDEEEPSALSRPGDRVVWIATSESPPPTSIPTRRGRHGSEVTSSADT